MKTFPPLYQKTQTGAIQQWTIATGEHHTFGPNPTSNPMIETRWGQVGGTIQVTIDVMKAGKNTGKKNATTPEQQAEKEAQARWTKQKKKGYVETVAAAEAGEVDAVIEGGVAPMLAPNKSYPKDDLLQKSIVYPAFFQPKLDGIRCVAVIEDGVASLWSRTRKRIKSVPHIVEALETEFPYAGRFVLDGELYCHELRDEFEELISIVRKDEPDAAGKHLSMEYHVYDLIEAAGTAANHPVTPATPFWARNLEVTALVGMCQKPLVRVETWETTSFESLLGFYEQALKDGYEGGMARNSEAPYESDKRSKHLQKMKEFEDHEFRITGCADGRGKDAGTAAAFYIATPCLCCGKGKKDGEGKARLKATYARRRELFQDPAQWEGKKATVTLKRWTEDGLPYLPIAKAIRDYE